MDPDSGRKHSELLGIFEGIGKDSTLSSSTRHYCIFKYFGLVCTFGGTSKINHVLCLAWTKDVRN